MPLRERRASRQAAEPAERRQAFEFPGYEAAATPSPPLKHCAVARCMQCSGCAEPRLRLFQRYMRAAGEQAAAGVRDARLMAVSARRGVF